MEYAKNKIAKLVYDYSKKGFLADKNFIDQIITLLVNALSINDYVLNREFTIKEDLLGGYDIFSKTIYIDIDKLFSNINSKINQESENGIKNTDYEFILKYNLSYVNTIAHEICHALQYKKVFINGDDLETRLLKLSFEPNLFIISSEAQKSILTSEEIIYATTLNDLEESIIYLDALPSERMACINASMLEKDIANIIINQSPISDYMKVKYKMEQIRGYLSGNCPTAYIMSVHNKLRNAYGLSKTCLPEKLYDNEKACIKIAKQDSINLNDRLYYGLYVTGEELKKHIDEINVLTKKLINNN